MNMELDDSMSRDSHCFSAISTIDVLRKTHGI